MTAASLTTDSYSDIQPLTTYVVPQKQAAKRHYGSHQYFTKALGT
jgi:hypothetical protein